MLKIVGFWGVLVVVLSSFAVLRYTAEVFFAAPNILVSDQDEPHQLSREGKFILEFDQRMNHESVEKALEIRPEIPYQLEWSGRELSLKPEKELGVGENYTVIVKMSAKSVFGKKLIRDYALRYIIGMDPHIVAIFPATPALKTHENIILIFSHAMVSDQDVGRGMRPDFLQLTPFTEGSWVWRDAKTLVFTAQKGFNSSTRYELISIEPLKAYDGTLLHEQIDQSFSTDRIAIVPEGFDDSEPENLRVHKVDEAFILSFTQSINISSLRESIHITDDAGKSVDQFSITPSPEKTASYLIKSRNNWRYHEKYHVLVGAGAMPEIGNLGLESESAFAFDTEPYLLESNVPEKLVGDNVLYVSQNALHISFPEAVELSRLKQALYFVPTIPYEVISLGDKEFSVVINDNSQKRENIKLYLSSAINPSGKVLIDRPVSFNLQDIGALSLDLTLAEGKMCFLSNEPLSKKSHALAEISGREEKWALEDGGDKSPCLDLITQEKPFVSELSQAFLEPNKENVLTVYAEDVFQQQKTEKFKVSTGSIASSDISLSIDDNTAWHYLQRPDQLVVNFQTRNVRSLKAELCKIPSEALIAVETTQEERWRSFTPSTEKCQRYRILPKEIQPRWGRIERHQLTLTEGFPEIEPGIYLVKLSMPYLDGEGKPFQESVVLQYSPWNILSKRGESGLIWLTDEQHQPISGARVVFYANDGTAQIKQSTDETGLMVLQDSKAKYEFIAISDGEQELVLNSFDQEGFEPSHFGIPFNVADTAYRYQFYTEDYNASPRQIRGVFVLREKTDGQLRIPKITSAVVTLSNQQEELLWRSIEPFDDDGNVYFDMKPTIPIFDGVYQLSVCLGLHDGVCQGTNLWTTIVKGQPTNEDFSAESGDIALLNDQQSSSKHLQIVSLGTLPKAGEEVTITINNVEPNIPLLFTSERDGIQTAQVLFPEKNIIETNITLSEEMIPEVVFTVTQFQSQGVLYDMKQLALSREQKILNPKPDAATIAFQLHENIDFPEDFLVNSFYPRLGTSIITAATAKPASSSEEVGEQMIPEIPADLVVVKGTLLFPSDGAAKQEVPDPSLKIFQDAEGRWGSVVKHLETEKPEISIDTHLPDFVREGDRIVAEVFVSNHGNKNKNVQLIGTGKGASFLGDRSFILGIAPGQKQSLTIPVVIGTALESENAQLDFEVLLEGDVLAHEQASIAIARLHAEPLHKKVVILESNDGQGMIPLPLQYPLTATRSVIIGLSPLSFVLENLNMMLQRDALHVEEIVFAAIAESSYGKIVQSIEAGKNELRNILKMRQNTEDVLAMLLTKQKLDGGWSDDSQQVKGNLMTTVWIAKALSLYEQIEQRAITSEIKNDLKTFLKSELDTRVNGRLASQNDQISPEEIFTELMVLNALSSLTPSGVSYANNWYLKLQDLSNESLVLLLLTFEDFRDAGITGVNFKIEEMIQLLKTRQRQDEHGVYLEKDSAIAESTNFMVTSWYLEALVRQASARTDLPPVITWLVNNKYHPEYQGPQDQFVFLTSMAAYLRIFQEDIQAKSIEVTLDRARYHFDIDPTKRFQTFFLKDAFSTSGTENEIPTVRFSADQQQPLFVEVNWESEERKSTSLSKGITAWVSFSKQQPYKEGEVIEGSISIVSAEPQRQVIVSQPLLASIKDLGQDLQEHDQLWKSQTFGSEEKWYLFDQLPAGETIIPFRWELASPGILNLPSVYAFVLEEPDTYALSTRQEIEVRPR